MPCPSVHPGACPTCLSPHVTPPQAVQTPLSICLSSTPSVGVGAGEWGCLQKGFQPWERPRTQPTWREAGEEDDAVRGLGKSGGLGSVGVGARGGSSGRGWGQGGVGLQEAPWGAPLLVSVELMGAVSRGGENVRWGGQGGAEMGAGVVARMQAVDQRDMAEEWPIEGLHGAVGRGPGVASVLACRKRCGRKKSDAKGDGQGPRRWTETSGNC